VRWRWGAGPVVEPLLPRTPGGSREVQCRTWFVMPMPVTSGPGKAQTACGRCRLLAAKKPMVCSPQLRDYRISRILSSPAVRCQQTVQPLAERRDLRVETANALGADADSTELVALLLDPAASETVLCSHGELIGDVLRWLLGHDLDGETLVWPKGSTWLLEVHRGQVQHRHYLPPLRLHDVNIGYS
jgi:phosphohistidine phosphatase SixA